MRSAPTPCPSGFPLTHAAAPFEGPLAALVAAYKDRGRRDCRSLLAGLLRGAVDAAVAADPKATRLLARGNGPILLVPTPSSRQSRRRRGDAPLTAVAREAARGYRPREAACADALLLRRRVADQAGLTARERAVNLEHAMEVRPSWRGAVSGACCVILDDVLTTGATLVEARRALVSAGAASVVAATVCATARRHPQRAQ